jgi:hypothetical protein
MSQSGQQSAFMSFPRINGDEKHAHAAAARKQHVPV